MSDIDSSDSETSWQECEEGNDPTEYESVTCIFTGKIFPGAEAYFLHLKNEHNFDIWNLVHVELNLDFFGYVKLINFLRSNFKGKPAPTASEMLSQKEVWDNESFLKPVVENDPLLQFIIDADVEDDDDFVSRPGASGVNDGAGEHHDPAMDVALTRDNLSHQLACNASLNLQVSEMKMRISEMKRVMQDIMIKNGDIYRPVSACRKPFENDQDDEEFEDSGYFRSYDHYDIHREMLQDKTRTCAYRDAMLKNPGLFAGKVVLDVGCGTGILSMFAVKAGAKCVYAVERSDIASSATANIYENGMADKIKVLHTSVEEIDLPVKHVDIIISEWMGYFLLYESMLDSVLHAASKWLAPDGVMLPNQCSIILAAADAEESYSRQVSYWDDVYGFKMPCMKTAVLREASVLNIPAKDVISSKVEVFDLAIDRNTTQRQLDFKSDFKMRALRDGKCSAIVGYFDVNFVLPEERVTLSTGPVVPGSGKETHWKQTVFFLPEPVSVKKDQEISGHIDCRKNPTDPRSLLVDLVFNGEKRQYTIS